MPDYQSQGGRTLVALAGVRGTFLASRRIVIYGELLPGAIRFAHAIDGPTHHLDLHLGLLFRWRLSESVGALLEYATDTYVFPGTVIGRSPPGPSGEFVEVSVPADVRNVPYVSAGMSYRIGNPRPSASRTSTVGRIAVGAHVSSRRFARPALPAVDYVRERLAGGFVSYALSRQLDLDGELSASLHASRFHSPYDGGRNLYGLVGVKTGVRQGRFGIFAKSRIGLVSASETLRSATSQPPFTFTHDRGNSVAVDVGGVIEMAINRPVVLRFDAGDLITRALSRTLTIDGQRINVPASPVADSIQFSLGIGWRFR